MYIPDFSERSARQELMDDLSVEGPELEGALKGLQRVNTLLGGYGPSIAGVKQLLTDNHQRSISLLDIGTGAADTPRKLAQWANSNNIRLTIHGIELSQTTVAYARMNVLAYKNISIRLKNLFELSEEQSYDIVHAALMLHHLSDSDAVRALQKMYAMSRLGVVINELHRHPIGYLGSLLVLPLISRNRLVRHDGPVSVLRAFTREELLELVQAAGLPQPRISWHPLFRWQMIISRSSP